MDFTHLLLTRFNVRRNPQGAPPDDAWMAQRLALFEQYCLPSILAQTTQNYRWLLYLDDETPDDVRSRLTGYGVSNMALVYLRDFMRAYRVRTAEYVNEEYLITTRIDNDDAIGAHFLEKVQACFDRQARTFVNFTDGYILDHPAQKLYLTRHLSNPFASLIERSQDFVSVWCAEHNHIADHGPVIQQPRQHNWMVVVHERNISNHIPLNLRRVSRARLTGEFSFALQGREDNQVHELLAVTVENQIRTMRRAARKLRRVLKTQ